MNRCKDCGEELLGDFARCRDCADARVHAWKAGELSAVTRGSSRASAKPAPVQDDRQGALL